MKKTLFVFLLINFIYLASNGQKRSTQKGDMITRILSDTLNPEINLIPVIVKFKGDNVTWLGYDHVLFLYEHFKEKKGSTMSEFEKQLRMNLIGGKAFEVDDDNYFKKKKFIPFSECGCLYIESSDKLKAKISYWNTNNLPNREFPCYVYRCFKKDIIIVQLEGKIGYKNE